MYPPNRERPQKDELVTNKRYDLLKTPILNRLLSFGRRVTLLKQVLQDIMMYKFSILVEPNIIFKDLD